MKVVLSPAVHSHHPDIEGIWGDVTKAARSLDRDLRTRYLYVKAHCHPTDHLFAGAAWPWESSGSPPRFLWHLNGRITMKIGRTSGIEDHIRLFAHELRHIGQFHRGQQIFGTLTCDHMCNLESEDDAREFEERVLDKLGV